MGSRTVRSAGPQTVSPAAIFLGWQIVAMDRPMRRFSAMGQHSGFRCRSLHEGFRSIVLASAFCGCVLLGCSAEKFKVGEVTGSVTLAGQPVEGALVQFEPEPVERKPLPAAYGMTDSSGRYRLIRSGGKGGMPGAVVGLNHVRISVPEGSSAKIHPRYGGDGTFWLDVTEGTNVLDFELVNDPLAVRPPGQAE